MLIINCLGDWWYVGYRVAQVGMVFILACAKSAHVFRSSLTVFLLKIRRKINNFKFSRRNSWRLKCKFATGKPRCRIIGSAVRVRVVSSHSVAPSFTWRQITASVDHAVNSACGCWLLYVCMHRQRSPASYEGCRIDIRLSLHPSLFCCSRQEEEGYRCM